jgi:hypothetical protein
MPPYSGLSQCEEGRLSLLSSELDHRETCNGLQRKMILRRVYSNPFQIVSILLLFSTILPLMFAIIRMVPVAWHVIPTSTDCTKHSERPSNPKVFSAADYFGFQHQWGFNVIFERDTNWFNMSHAWDDEWKALSGKTGGLLHMYDTEAGRDRPWGVSMFHQLHCLAILRAQMQQLQDALADGQADEGRAQELRLSNTHYQHCFDYLRQVRIKKLMTYHTTCEDRTGGTENSHQTLLCFADETLEKSQLGSDGMTDVVNGWYVGSWHI